MSKKKDAPPRPPAPKLTLNKLGSRQGSVGSISVHYSPLMDDNNSDLDEDVVFDPGTSSDQAPQQVSIKSKTWLVQQQQSRSAPSSEATTPVSTGPKLIGQSSLDQGLARPNQDVAAFHEGSEKSLLSGLREKLNDLPNAFIGKIEEISNETVFADIVDRKIKKSDSMDSSTHNFGTLALSQTSVHIIDSKKSQTSTPSDIAIEEMITPTEALPIQNARKRHDTSESLYSCPETELWENHHTSDAMSGGWSKSPVGSARERGFSPHKTSTDKTPMTLSGLLMNRDDSIEEISRSESENVFYDTTENLPDISSSKVTPKKNPSTPKYSWSILSVQQIFAVVVCILACLMIPLPSFISGLLSGIAMTICIIKLHQFVTQPSRPKEPFTVPDVDTLPPMRMPEMRESVNEVGKFKGWMNEVTRYDLSDYHINQTQSVFLHLEGANLRLQRATSRVAKRAMWTESQHSSIIFSPYQRFLKLTDANVSLLPKGIVRKRFWSKKYPILIELVASIQDPIPLDDLVDPITSVEDLSSVKDSDPAVRRLYLFARTPREKEEWYWRFVAAAAGRPLPTKMAELLTKIETPKSQGSSVTSPDSPSGISRRRRVESNNSDSETISLEMPLSEDYLPEYMKYMARIMPTRHGIPGAGKGPRLCEPNLVFLNAFIARFFWDFLREKYWAGKIRTKIQKKLSKIHVPYFIDELTVTGIEIGSEMPVIRRSTQPFLNDRGLWSDLDITYNGGFRMRLETKVNLMKLKKMSSGSTITLETKETKYTKGSAVLNSDEEDSAESSTDDESMEEKPAETPDDKAGGSMKGKKLLRFVDKIAQSKYFQQVAEYKYIRKAMEEVSNTRLVLTVELKSLSGTLAINIPPPPTDRLWYGFRTNPRLWLSAKPRVGDREVNVSHITDWIEKKLAVEFQRVFVMPNMDDLVIPLMCSHMPCDCCQSKAEDPTTAR